MNAHHITLLDVRHLILVVPLLVAFAWLWMLLVLDRRYVRR